MLSSSTRSPIAISSLSPEPKPHEFQNSTLSSLAQLTAGISLYQRREGQLGSREAGMGSQHLQVRQHHKLRVGPVQKKFDECAKPVSGASRSRSCRRHGCPGRRGSRDRRGAAAAASATTTATAAARRDQLVVLQLHWGHGGAQPGSGQPPEMRPWSLLPGSVTAPRRARAEWPPPSARPPLNRKPSTRCGGPPPCRARRAGHREASAGREGREAGRPPPKVGSFRDCSAAARPAGCSIHVAEPRAEVSRQDGRETRGRPFPKATCDRSPRCAVLGGKRTGCVGAGRSQATRGRESGKGGWWARGAGSRAASSAAASQ